VKKIKDITDGLLNYINKNGLKKYIVAQKAGLTASQFSAVLNKKRKLEVNEFIRICEALKTTPEELKNFELRETC